MTSRGRRVWTAWKGWSGSILYASAQRSKKKFSGGSRTSAPVLPQRRTVVSRWDGALDLERLHQAVREQRGEAPPTLTALGRSAEAAETRS